MSVAGSNVQDGLRGGGFEGLKGHRGVVGGSLRCESTSSNVSTPSLTPTKEALCTRCPCLHLSLTCGAPG